MSAVPVIDRRIPITHDSTSDTLLQDIVWQLAGLIGRHVVVMVASPSGPRYWSGRLSGVYADGARTGTLVLKGGMRAVWESGTHLVVWAGESA